MLVVSWSSFHVYRVADSCRYPGSIWDAVTCGAESAALPLLHQFGPWRLFKSKIFQRWASHHHKQTNKTWKHMERLWNMSVAEPMKPDFVGFPHFSGWKFSCQGTSSLYRALKGYRMDVFVAAHMHSPVVLPCFAQRDGWQTTSDWTLLKSAALAAFGSVYGSMVGFNSGSGPADGWNLDTDFEAAMKYSLPRATRSTV